MAAVAKIDVFGRLIGVVYGSSSGRFWQIRQRVYRRQYCQFRGNHQQVKGTSRASRIGQEMMLLMLLRQDRFCNICSIEWHVVVKVRWGKGFANGKPVHKRTRHPQEAAHCGVPTPYRYDKRYGMQ